ncbi:MAG: hypothetical protein AUI14_20010 [Actinobacteria bacterium 13_2_20CM_2_71_6]|jgi:membrane-associated two-gene conflict system component 1 (EACC1)|nr:MAG: hypothetical protein AUI14_20010 [Actinobacteria bacterium 13_2_20CM_2_71_6]
MDLRISVSSDPGTDSQLRSLVDWLDHEPELRGRVRALARPPAGNELGATTDAVQVALGAGGAIAVLASSLRVWFAQPRRSDVRLKIRGSSGRTIEVDAKRVSNVEALIREVLNADAGPGDEPS